jgi:hypothetical protein
MNHRNHRLRPRRRSQINRTTRTDLLNSRHSLPSAQTLRLYQRLFMA